mmetsp:Transcript_68834/g.153622  ORF Transcript_68834/g.153622 Transcript_68834/m.153622 type:complete len:95 (+) Transcript_68834:707-991(+)
MKQCGAVEDPAGVVAIQDEDIETGGRAVRPHRLKRPTKYDAGELTVEQSDALCADARVEVVHCCAWGANEELIGAEGSLAEEGVAQPGGRSVAL